MTSPSNRLPSSDLPSSDLPLGADPPSATSLWIGGTLLLWALYAFVFVQTAGESWSDAAVDALANILPLALLAVAAHATIRAYVMPQRVWMQAALHVALAVAFATTWYATVLVLLAFCTGVRGGGFAVSGFAGPAFTWQVFQGLILYGGIAAVCYAVRGGRRAAQLTMIAPATVLTAAASAPPPLDRYLTRTGDAISPVEVRDIVSITGAQDYSEVATLASRHLVRLSLGEFEARLDPQRFLRVHRSTIINFAHLARAEPAGGGRMIAHMTNGDAVQVSRAGTLVLRQFIV